ncbi:MAG: hypothetical protein GY711_26460 [bacterium]|nr:hypothetical protein [bacterium]
MTIAHVGLLIALCGLAKADGGGTFVARASLSLARQEVGAARVGDSVYVVGGLIQGFNTTATVEVYDLAKLPAL